MRDELVKRLRKFDWRGKVRTATAHEAADRIEALEAEVERLREVMTIIQHLRVRQKAVPHWWQPAPHWERNND